MKNLHVVHDWRRRYDDFPEPVKSLSHFHLWLWPDIEAWARKTGRLDRPAKP